MTHPRGLSVLFFTEMWERFSYYGMRSLLILFMIAPGGLALSTKRAASIYGLYTMSVYAFCIVGGWIADRYLGHYRAVLFGGVLIMCGHFSMAVPSTATFFAGLALIVLGTGLLKPNVSTLVGMLYKPDDARRDSAYSLFYMGINIGATSAPLVCGWLGQKVNWHIGFAAAGVGMGFGLVQYVLGRKHLNPTLSVQPSAISTQPSPVREPLTPADYRRLALIGVFFLFSLIFWAGFEQAGSTLTLFAERHTRLTLAGFSFPSSWFQSEQPLFVIALAPVFAWLWLRLGRRDPSGPVKFAMGLTLLAAGYFVIVPAARLAQAQGVRVGPMWLTTLYLLHTLGELCVSPVGLSLVSKLAPRKLAGLMMGCWFLATAIGNFIAGWVAGFSDTVPIYRLFLTNALITLAAAAILAILVMPISAMTATPPVVTVRAKRR
jgi:POT family proton-dependent oligopeptide transporter